MSGSESVIRRPASERRPVDLPDPAHGEYNAVPPGPGTPTSDWTRQSLPDHKEKK